MTPRQWRVVLALAVAVGVLGVVVGLVALLGGDGSKERVDAAGKDSTSTSSTVASSTTVALRPVAPPTTAAGPTETTGAPSETTTGPAPVVGPQGAVLRRTTGSEERRRAPGGGCTTLAQAGYRAECGDVSDGGDDFVWMIEERLTNGGLRAAVMVRTGPSTYRSVLEALDDGPAGPVRFAAISVAVADVSGDGTPEIAFGFRSQGSGAILDLDLVDAPGRVVVHRTLDKGRGSADEGRLDDWAAEFGPNDAACCPSRFRHAVVRFADDAWRIVESRLEPASQVPEGDFE